MNATTNHIPRKILMTADNVGGVWAYAVELCGQLCAHGTQVMLAVTGAAFTQAQQNETARIDKLQARWRPYKLEWMPDSEGDIRRTGDWLIELCHETEPDIVHLNNYAHAALPFGVPVLVTAHSSVCTWFESVKGVEMPAQYSSYKEWIQTGLDAADIVVAPTMAMLESLWRRYGVDWKGTVIHNGRSGFESCRGSKEEIILSMGRLWDEGKNIAVLERIAGRLPWPVYVAGELASPDGSSRSFNNISAIGMLEPDSVRQWLLRTAIYAAPAKYEPFGLGILEAAMAGCALVLGDIPSLRELWDGCAVFASPDDEEQLEKAIIGLIQNAYRRKQMGQKAMNRAEMYSARAMGTKYMELYSELLNVSKQSLEGSLI
ncbi:MAG: hypothetical protein A2Y07_03660 [Planctomycetes bacterium GWF2_50_10]|nr:MAG: hypothetical protein A2Y07_03660 [Planctomycetes bacterium GWF2_50_10]